MKSLVAFFSASGVTKKVSVKLASALNADIYEIKPAVRYSKADLNWMNKKSRSSVEMNDKSIRPEIIRDDIDLTPFDVIYLGFPIWWYVAPTVINSFLESYDFSGKKIVLFATAGSSGFGNTLPELKISAEKAEFETSKVLTGIITDKKINDFIESVI